MSTESFEWVSEATISDAEVEDGNQAQDDENEAGASCQEHPANQEVCEVSNESYHEERHISNGRQRRTGLRTRDRHASWREVYRACGVGGGGHE